MHHPAAGRLGDLLPHPGTEGAGRGQRGTHRAQGWGPLRGGVRPQKQGTHPRAQLESQISLAPPSEAGILTEGQDTVRSRRQAHVIRARAPPCMHTARTSRCNPGWGRRGTAPGGSPIPPRKRELLEQTRAPAGRPLFLPPFLHVEKVCISPGSLFVFIYLFSPGAWAPEVPSDPGTGSLPDPCPCPLLPCGGRRRSFPGGRGRAAPGCTALRDGARAACN